MENGKNKPEAKTPYVKPEVLASYKNQELGEIIRPSGGTSNRGSEGCGWRRRINRDTDADADDLYFY